MKVFVKKRKPVPLKVLVACEESGAVRDAFNALGHVAYSCDLKPAQGLHYQCNVLSIINQGWDLMIAHPPCTYLSSSGLHWTNRGLRDPLETERALRFVQLLMNAPIPRIAIENPSGCISTRIREADQYVQPYEFGDDASKNTGLWLKNLHPLRKTKYVKPRMVNGKPRWGNQCDSGQNILGPSSNRAETRSKTYTGIARAMAEQWGGDTGWRHIREGDGDCEICKEDYFSCLCPFPSRPKLETKMFHGILMGRR